MNYALVPPISMDKPTRCHWCTGMLKGLKNIYKGINSERHYCSALCHRDGEDRAIRYRGVLAGTISSHYLISACILALCMLAFIFTGGSRALAHNPETHQADPLSEARSEAFGTCCSGDDFLRVTLWERTDLGFRIYVAGRWMEAGHRVKVSNMENPDGEAKVWVNGPKDAPYVRCFMPGSLS